MHHTLVVIGNVEVIKNGITHFLEGEGVSVLDVLKVNGDVIIPVRALMFVVEPYGVSYLMDDDPVL